MKDTPYGWRMTAEAALKWAIKGQTNIEERLAVIRDDPDREEERRKAKAMWQALRSAEVKIQAELTT